MAWSTSVNAQQCQYRLDMFDSFGDGWNGGALTVHNSGNTMSFSLSSSVGNGKDSSVYFTVTADVPLVLSWSAGVFDHEVSFVLYDNDGEVVFWANHPKAGLLLFLPKVKCYTCLRPRDLRVENLWDTRARIAWTPTSGGQPPIGWRVIYGKANFDPNVDGQVKFASQSRIVLSDLEPYTLYDCYVVQACDNDSTSRFTGPLRFRTYRANDVGISAILTPTTDCQLGTSTITVSLRNYGGTPQTLIPLNFSVNGALVNPSQPLDGLYTDILGKDSAAVFIFKTPFDFYAPGEYLITAWTEMKGDEDPSNDTARLRILNRVQPPYFQDFEDWEGGWITGSLNAQPSSWQWGSPAGARIQQAGSGQKAWVTRLDGLYSPNEYSFLLSPCFDISELTHDPVIEFLLYYDTEADYDGAWLEVSTDDGTTWEKTGQLGDDINWYNGILAFNATEEAWTGDSEGWRLARYPLTGTAGETTVRARLVFRSDPLIAGEGIGIDAIRIYEPAEKDLAILNIRTADNAGPCGIADDFVLIEVANMGRKPVNAYSAGYALPNKPAVSENVGTPLIAPNQVAVHTFAQPFDSRDANFTLRAWVTLNNDAQPANDSAAHRIYYLPIPLPLSEGFGNGLPKGWSTNGNVNSDNGNTSNVLGVNLSSFNPFFELTLPRYGPVAAGDTLAFQYRITEYGTNGNVPAPLGPGTYFEWLISTDCGETFQTLHTINANNHILSTAMRQIRVDMTPYAGQAVLLRLEGVWASGDFVFDLDNIHLPAPATVFSPTRPEAKTWNVHLWPNPTAGIAYVQAQGHDATEVHLQVLDATGRLWWERRLPRTEHLYETLDLSAVPAGLYWLRTIAGTHTSTHKIIKR